MLTTVRLHVAAVLVALALPVGTATSAAAPVTLGFEGRPTTVAAWRGDVVWSTYDAAAAVYRLVRSHDGGPAVRLPVAPAPRPFDVDLGSTRSGATAAVYTRCDDGTTGCDIYRLGLDTGREQRVATLSSPVWDERDPTIYLGRIAFVRRERVGGRIEDTLRLGDTTSGSRGSRILVRGGELSAPELAQSDVAYVVTVPEGRGGLAERQVHVLHTSTGRDRTVDLARSGGADAAAVTGPSLGDAAGSFVWARTNAGSPAGNRIVRYGLRSRTLAYAPASSRWTSTSWAGGALGLITTGTWDGTSCYADSAESPLETFCAVRATGPVTWSARP